VQSEASAASRSVVPALLQPRSELQKQFPFAIPILGSKHLLDNLAHDVTKAMPGFVHYKDNQLKPVARLLSHPWWRERLQEQCFKGSPYYDDFNSFQSSIEHVDLRWGELVADFLFRT